MGSEAISGGWRGYDPTLGLAVGDRHVALAASAIPSYAASVSGSVTLVESPLKSKIVQSQLQAHITMQVEESKN